MNDSTSVLFGLEDEFVVSSVERLDHRPVVRVKDLDASGQAVELWWRKRRLRWLEPPCPLAYGLSSIPLLTFDYGLGQMKTWVDLQELYWLLQEVRLRRSLYRAVLRTHRVIIAASPLDDYSPEVPSPRIDDGINTAEMQDLERIAEQTREPLDQVISRLAWNDNFALAASTLRDAHPDSFTGAEIVAEDRAWISFAGSPPADAWAIIDSFKAIAPHVNVELRGGEGYSELDLQKAIENTHYVLLDSSAVRDANTTFDIEDRIITTAVLLTDGQPESVVSDLEILARRGLSTLPAQAGITSEVIMSSSASLGSNEHNDYHHGGEVLSACTSGFGTRATSHTSGSRAIATAGHCPDTMTDDGHTLTLMGSGYEGTHGDFQRHTGPKTETDDFYAGVATITEDVLRDVSGIGAPTVGLTLCQNGKVTHFNCQQVRKLNVCQGSVCNLVQMGAHLTASGDSGSPVFFGNVAYGIHKGMMYDPVAPFSRGTFSRADRIDNALGVWIATN